MEFQNRKKYFLGLSLAPNSNYDSGVAVLDENLNVVYLDKLYSDEDIKHFLKNYNSINETIFAVSLAQDNTLLTGKWRMMAKGYKQIEDRFDINSNNWTNRLTSRISNFLKDMHYEGYPIFRYYNFQLRQAMGVSPNYPERTSIDCKSLQTALKYKFSITSLPENMLPASNLEAILGAIFAKNIHDGKKYEKIGQFNELDILNCLF